MSEYVATVQIKRSARGEGDEPMLVVGASGSSHKYPPEDAIDAALEEALDVVRTALLTRKGEA